MVDFKAHLAKGYSAYEKATAARTEVKAVLRELTSQVEEFTNGKVGIKLKDEVALFSNNIVENLVNVASGNPVSMPTNIQINLVAYDKSQESSTARKLASWTQEKDGYPCVLRFANAKHEAYDRTSLEKVLSELLAWSETGRIISSIAAKSPKANEIEGKPTAK